ncbi:MAG: hypothetical protein B7Y02_08730, partial [Rhodobacterales bacterium 17-64-5]
MSLSIYPYNAGGLQKYFTGDHLVVYPTNQRSVVDQYLSRLDLSALQNNPDGAVRISRLDDKQIASICVPAECKAITPRQILTHFADLQFTPSPKMLRSLSELAESTADREYVKKLGEDYKKEVVMGN